MFYLRYFTAELLRRKGRTILTAVGLAVAVGLVVAVSSLSKGLDRAQGEILEPLTGVGTDMRVSRPISVDEDAAGPFGSLGPREQRQLEREHSSPVGDIEGDPGDRVQQSTFVATELSFPQDRVDRTARLDRVGAVAGELQVNLLEIAGVIAEEGLGQTGAPGRPGRPGGGHAGLNDVDFNQIAVAGVDQRAPELAAVSPAELIDGDYLAEDGGREALVSQAHAASEAIELGDRVGLGERGFEVVGIVQQPLGGVGSEVYVPLAELQRISDRQGRINVLRVRVVDAASVEAVAARIESDLEGGEVTTAAELADRVTGSLADAQSLSDRLGIALSAVALISAFLIASMLALSSVQKRVRELGTLKAIGWPSRLVVRQVSGESLAQGAIGGALGIALGLGAAALIGTLGIELEASVAAGEQPAFGAFGGGEVAAGERSVTLDAPVDPGLLVLAFGLALLGGLIAGAAGAARAARLRPAEALGSVE